MNPIEAEHLTRDYDGVCAVDDLNFPVEAGEVFGFLGPNGAGKTTTIKLLSGQLRPTSGTARVAGFDVRAPQRPDATGYRCGLRATEPV